MRIAQSTYRLGLAQFAAWGMASLAPIVEDVVFTETDAKESTGRVMENNLILRNIKALREFHGITMQEFADAIGMSISVVSLAESEKRPPSAEYVLNVSRGMHVPLDRLYKVDMGAEFCGNRACGDETATPDAEAAQEGQTPATGQNQGQAGQGGDL